MVEINLEQLHINGTITRGEELHEAVISSMDTLARPLSTSFGPLGLDKMIINTLGDVKTTNDGATILSSLHVQDPFLKLVVQLSNGQDTLVGDGTTTVVLLACALIRSGISLRQKLPASVVLSGFKAAYKEAMRFVQGRTKDATKLDAKMINSLVHTAIRSKVIFQEAQIFTELLSAAHLRSNLIDLPVYKAFGGGMADSRLYDGFLLNCRPDANCASLDDPKRKSSVRVICIDFDLQKVRLPMNVNVAILTPSEADNVRAAEENITRERIQALVKANVSLVLTTKGIDDFAARLLHSHNIAAVKRCLKDDLVNICKVLGTSLVRTLSDFSANNVVQESMVGTADAVKTLNFAENKVMVQISSKKCASLVLHGNNEQVLDEMERSVHDALCVLKRVRESKAILPGGGAIETALYLHLHEFSQSVSSREYLAIEKYADALLSLPRLLAENAHLDSDKVLAELLNVQSMLSKQNVSEAFDFGLDLSDDLLINNNYERGIVEPAAVKLKALRAATEAALSVLRIDEMIVINKEEPKPSEDQCH